ncbi:MULTISPECIES: ABC transporter ATP-binding protein [Mesorhizobium]|uniref:ABC transporter ATP-binding protein n=1 Tax=Mesorhizobium TaxID=68287 RepID=UPI0010A97ADD|nr:MULTISPECIES: ABC transporter ATP-binding protein [Mesorhizobium]
MNSAAFTRGAHTTAVAETPLLNIDGLCVDFKSSAPRKLFARPPTFRALDNIDLTLRRGETLGLIGESGSGKTTLGRAIMGLTRSASGKISFRGDDIASLSPAARKPYLRHLQMVFQDPYSSLHPRQTIGRSLEEPLRIQGTVERSERRQRVFDLLQRVGLDRSHAGLYPLHLSGGQRQRVAIARAIANEPDLIIADEPVSALDVSIQAQILNLLRDLQRETGMAMLFISHDLSVVRHLCDRIAVMYLGRVVEIGPTEDIIARPRHPYTAALLSAAPRIHRLEDSSPATTPIQLEGDIPSHAHVPSGCAFHTRCWLYNQLGRPEACRETMPALHGAAHEHQVRCLYPDMVAERLAGA